MALTAAARPIERRSLANLFNSEHRQRIGCVMLQLANSSILEPGPARVAVAILDHVSGETVMIEINDHHSPESQASTIHPRGSARTADDREHTRYPVHQLLWLVSADGRRSCATMVDVSRRGFGIRTSHPPASGERVVLSGGLGDIPGEIRWSADGRAGGVFMPPDDF
jgi:hypothetical protein